MSINFKINILFHIIIKFTIKLIKITINFQIQKIQKIRKIQIIILVLFQIILIYLFLHKNYFKNIQAQIKNLKIN